MIKRISIPSRAFYRDGVLLHIINMKGKSEPVEITLKGKRWEGVQSAYLEPEHRQVEVRRRGSNKIIIISKGDVDHIDTISLFARYRQDLSI